MIKTRIVKSFVCFPSGMLLFKTGPHRRGHSTPSDCPRKQTRFSKIESPQYSLPSTLSFPLLRESPPTAIRAYPKPSYDLFNGRPPLSRLFLCRVFHQQNQSISFARFLCLHMLSMKVTQVNSVGVVINTNVLRCINEVVTLQ